MHIHTHTTQFRIWIYEHMHMPYTQEEWRGEKMRGNKTDFFYKLRQREVGREGAQPRDKCDGGKKTTALFT